MLFTLCCKFVHQYRPPVCIFAKKKSEWGSFRLLADRKSFIFSLSIGGKGALGDWVGINILCKRWNDVTKVSRNPKGVHCLANVEYVLVCKSWEGLRLCDGYAGTCGLEVCVEDEYLSFLEYSATFSFCKEFEFAECCTWSFFFHNVVLDYVGNIHFCQFWHHQLLDKDKELASTKYWEITILSYNFCHEFHHWLAFQVLLQCQILYIWLIFNIWLP